MNAAEAALLLSMASAYDNRTVSEITARAWAEALSDVDVTDAKTVLVEHYRQSRVWLMPVDILDGVRDIRRARLRATPVPVPEINPDDSRAYLAAYKASVAGIAAGATRQIGA
ncbi:MAG: hypothetical protein NVV70_17010 [Cellulomonas sp.]|nr:hypothetical protein [Cellulomonas sp.]MCR6649747.1 hypothetical protein [Cellulomonas sp.]